MEKNLFNIGDKVKTLNFKKNKIGVITNYYNIPVQFSRNVYYFVSFDGVKGTIPLKSNEIKLLGAGDLEFDVELYNL